MSKHKNERKTISIKVGIPRLYKRQIIIENYETIDVEDRVDFLISRLQELENQYKNSYDDLRVEGFHECHCEGSCDCSPKYYLVGKRLETDVEYNFRLMREKERERHIQDLERAEFERLKKKFETTLANLK